MAVTNEKALSVYLCLLLRHKPEAAGLEKDMDIHGYIPVDKLISAVNEHSPHHITRALLEKIVSEDEKGRYRFSDDGSKIKCCQGHSIEWVQPEVTEKMPPEKLFHGTNTAAMERIFESGGIRRMKRHAVHLRDDIETAAQSARRWRKLTPVVLEIDSAAMSRDGISFFISDNGVWLTEDVPVKYITEKHFI